LTLLTTHDDGFPSTPTVSNAGINSTFPSAPLNPQENEFSTTLVVPHPYGNFAETPGSSGVSTPTLNLKIDGVSRRAIVDTGSAISVLDTSLWKNQLPETSPWRLRSAAGDATALYGPVNIVRPYANLPNSPWLVEDAQLAPCRPNLPNSGTLVKLAQLIQASSDMTHLDFRGSEIFIRVDSWKKYLSFELCDISNDYLCKLQHAVVSTVRAHFNSRFPDRKCPTQIRTNAIYRA